MPDKPPISAAIIAGDEEARLKGCIDSLSMCDEVVVVVDARATDATEQIARDCGARVFVEQWKGFGPQKQSAIDKCRHDMVLLIDADERLSDGAGKAIMDALVKAPSAAAYSFRRKSYIADRWIRHGGWWPDRLARLIDRRRCHMDGMIHERVVVEGETVPLDINIEHFTFDSYSDMIARLDSYSEQTSDDLIRRNVHVGPFTAFTHAISMFVRVYIFKRGFLDGLDGLVIALLNAGGSFFKYAKALEKRRAG